MTQMPSPHASPEPSSSEPATGRDLRRRYVIHAQLGLVAALLVVIGALQVNWESEADDVHRPLQSQDRIEIQEVDRVEADRAPRPPRPEPPNVVPDDAIVEEEPIDWDAPLAPPDAERIDDLAAFNWDAAGNMDELGTLNLWESVDGAEVDWVGEQGLEQTPQPVGGRQALEREFRYPQAAQESGMEGALLVSFIVDEYGQVRDVQIPRGAHALLDEETVRALQQTQFEPGVKEGRAVAVRAQMRVRFELMR